MRRHSGDLDRRSEVHDLVVAFYREVVFDDLLAPVFGEVAEVDWADHIPKLIDYWCRVLLDEPGYDGAVLAAHRHVHALDPLRVEHFDRWYAVWVASIDARWAGPVAERRSATPPASADRSPAGCWPPTGGRRRPRPPGPVDTPAATAR